MTRRPPRGGVLRWLAVSLALMLAGCGHVSPDPLVNVASAAAWPEADRVYRDQPRWLGADGGQSVDLGNGRTLWLFGDTLVARQAGTSMDGAFFVSNTMALSDGDPAAHPLRFSWREGPPDSPLPPAVLAASGQRSSTVTPILADQGDLSLWPGHGLVVDGHLVVFASRIQRGEGAFGFQGRGWTAYIVDDLQGDPSSWSWREAAVSNPFGDDVALGTGSLLHVGDHVVAFGSGARKDADGWTRHPAYAARWTREDLLAGRLQDPEWLDARGHWWPQADLAAPPELFDAAPAFSVQWNARLGLWLEVQSTGFGATPIDLRSAPDLHGPWSPLVRAYAPPEMEDQGLLEYNAVAHPQFGNDGVIVVSYSINVLDGRQPAPGEYAPRFARIQLA